MDCAVIPCKKHKDLAIVQTVDFFYPLVDSPEIMGKIALANVVSDVYAVGVTAIDQLQMIISAPTELDDQERDIIIPMIIKGFKQAAEEINCTLHIQSMCWNPWCIIGGIATSICKRNEIIMPINAMDGDHLILTKPLGMQLATNAYIWLCDKNDKYQQLSKSFSDEEISRTFDMAIKSMTFLNKQAAKLMHKYNANAATDITGFGLLGHTENLATFQKHCLEFVITKLPILKNVFEFSKILSCDTKLRNGKAVETSGGLLISMPSKFSQQFCQEYHSITNNQQYAWIIGYVRKSDTRKATLCKEPEFLEIEL